MSPYGILLGISLHCACKFVTDLKYMDWLHSAPTYDYQPNAVYK